MSVIVVTVIVMVPVVIAIMAVVGARPSVMAPIVVAVAVIVSMVIVAVVTTRHAVALGGDHIPGALDQLLQLPSIKPHPATAWAELDLDPHFVGLAQVVLASWTDHHRGSPLLRWFRESRWRPVLYRPRQALETAKVVPDAEANRAGMSSETLKSFAALHEDYAFFEAHATETQATLPAWLKLVGDRRGPLRALDFGAGSGSFTSTFLKGAAFEPASLRLTLVEPDDGFRARAEEVLAPFSSHPIEAWPLLDRDLEPAYDLIFSHHVLYYVPNLEETLARLVGGLRPGGRMLLVQGGQRNGLNTLVFAAFDRIGERSPYNYSEDTAEILRRLHVDFQLLPISSSVDFPDSEEGRWRMLRFLLGEHLSKLAPEEALSLFEPFVRGDRVHFESVDELFVVDRELARDGVA